MRLFRLLLLVLALGAALAAVPRRWVPAALHPVREQLLGEAAYHRPPESETIDFGEAEPPCASEHPEWREAQVVEGVEIERSAVCEADNPWIVAAAVKGTNHVSMDTLMRAGLAADAVVVGGDLDGDGDADEIEIKLEVVELNGRSPDTPELIPRYAIAPGIEPGFWVFSPKSFGMATRSLEDLRANPLFRVPSPTIRVEQGDRVRITLENTHYLPHTIHFHGVDHPYHFHLDASDLPSRRVGNDGVPETDDHAVMPGETHTYAMAPRHAGTKFYHCHVQPQAHLLMGLQGMFVIEENRPANSIQTLNVGAGQVRHRSLAVREQYAHEYDLHYMDLDKELHGLVQKANDPRLIARAINRTYDITERTPDYFLLNGRSFPYTFRESLVVVKPDDKVKLRVLNGGLEQISLHPHGQALTETHYDGIEVGAAARVMRDVVPIPAAGRVDLLLEATDDGLHSYGEGVWVLHDHNERAFTTDGVSPGGSITAIAYESYLDERGWPVTHGIDWRPFFSAEYYRRKIPVWVTYDEPRMLGEAGSAPLPWRRLAATAFLAGLGLGVLGAAVSGRGRKRGI
ncbi:MAG: multicopper oxidase domain-containing protein [Candidatus Binatia bacterium]